MTILIKQNLKKVLIGIASCLCCLSFALLANGQSSETVNSRELKGRVFEIKYRDPASLLNVIKPLGSASKDAMMSSSSEFKSISVRDYPENLAAIEEAIKRLDIPQSSYADIDLKIHVLIASKKDGVGNQLSADIKRATKQMEPALNYKSFYYVTTITHRLKDGAHEARGRGVVELGTPLFKDGFSAGYEFRIKDSFINSNPGSAVIKLKELVFAIGSSKLPLGEAQIRTDVSAKNGEHVIVGTASLKDKALVLVLVPTIIK
jgi:hypothetical protein